MGSGKGEMRGQATLRRAVHIKDIFISSLILHLHRHCSSISLPSSPSLGLFTPVISFIKVTHTKAQARRVKACQTDSDGETKKRNETVSWEYSKKKKLRVTVVFFWTE